jgi:hypothetical protein
MRHILAFCSLFIATTVSAAAQERQWSLDVSDTDVYLAFGVPETDDIGVSFWCPLHSGEVRLFLPETDAGLKPGRNQSFTLTAGGKWFRFDGKTTANEEAGSISIEGSRPAGDEVFAVLAKSDRFTVTIRKQQITFPLVEADVAGLVDRCAKP